MGSQQQYCLRWNNHQSNILSVFDSLFQNEAMVDVTLACEGLSIKAHKMVLSACSPYFQSLFMENPCKHPIVILKDVSFLDLKALMDFMYKGEVNVNQEQLDSLLKTAETLKVRGLTEVANNAGDLQNSILSQERELTHLPPPHLAGVAPPQPSTQTSLVHTLNRSSPSPKRRKKMQDRHKTDPSPSPSELEDNDNIIEPKVEIKEGQQSNELVSKTMQASLVHPDQAPGVAFQSNGSQGLTSANDASPSMDQNFTVRPPNEAIPTLYKSPLCQLPGLQGESKDLYEETDGDFPLEQLTIYSLLEFDSSLKEPDVEISAIDDVTKSCCVNQVADPDSWTTEEPDPSSAEESSDSDSEEPDSTIAVLSDACGIQNSVTSKLLEFSEISRTIDAEPMPNISTQTTQNNSMSDIKAKDLSVSASISEQPMLTMAHHSTLPGITQVVQQIVARIRMMQQSSMNALMAGVGQHLQMSEQSPVAGMRHQLPMTQQSPAARHSQVTGIRQHLSVPRFDQQIPVTGRRQQMSVIQPSPVIGMGQRFPAVQPSPVTGMGQRFPGVQPSPVTGMGQRFPAVQPSPVTGMGQRFPAVQPSPVTGMGQQFPAVQPSPVTGMGQQLSVASRGHQLQVSTLRQQSQIPRMNQQSQIPEIVQRMPVPGMIRPLPVSSVGSHSSVQNIMCHASTSPQSQVQEAMQRLMICGNMQRLCVPLHRNQ